MRTCTTWLVFSVLICGFFWLPTEAGKGNYSYDRPGDWYLAHGHEACGERLVAERQSPIDIVYDGAVYKTPAQLPPLEFNYINSDDTFNVTYHGDGGGFSLDPNFVGAFQMTGGNLPATFNLLQFHFHTESEHTKESENALMEIHLVHANSMIAENVKSNPNGLSVFGIMFELGPENVFLGDLLEKLQDKNYEHKIDDHSDEHSEESGSTHDVKTVTMEFPHMSGLFPDDAQTRFYTYPGSLTTPPCYESVTWFVGATKQTMSIEQFIAINRLHTSSTTHRPIQPTNDRVLARSFIGEPVLSLSAGFIAPVYSASVYFLLSVSMVISTLVF